MAEQTTAPPRALDPAVLAYRRSPAHELAEDMEAGSGERVTLREIPFLTQIAIRVWPGTPGGDALEAALGVALPRSVGEIGGEGGGPAPRAGAHSVLWLSPDEFLLVAPDEAEAGESTAALTDSLATALGEEPGQVVDVSANRTTLELRGPDARSVLDKGCHLDLHPREFPVGQAVATLLAAVPIILWRTGEDTWRLLPRASFATFVVRWLLDGMREFQ